MKRLQQVVTLFVVVWLTACVQSPSKKPADKTKQAEINTQLGIEYLREGIYETSHQKLEKALKQDSRYAPAHDAIAVLYEQIGDPDKAETHYKRSLALDRKNASTLNNYGQFLCRQNKLEQAESYFLKAVEDNLYRYPEMIYTNAGICAAKTPNLRKAENYYRKALTSNKKYPPALKEMVRLSFSQDNYLGARAYLQRYEAQGPLTAELLWIAVLTEKQLGDRIALSKYKLLLKKKFPDSAQANQLRKWDNEQSR